MGPTQSAQTLTPAGETRLCWDGFGVASTCEPASYRVWWSYASNGTLLGDANIPAGSGTCVEDQPLLTHGIAYVVQVEATGVSGLVSRAAEVRIVADETPPKPTGAETVATGGISTIAPSPGHFSSVGCCALVSWPFWVEPESRLTYYNLCVQQLSQTLVVLNDALTYCHQVDGTTSSVLMKQDGCDCGSLGTAAGTSSTWILNSELSTGGVYLSVSVSADNGANLRFTNSPFVVELGSEHNIGEVDAKPPMRDAFELCDYPSQSDISYAGIFMHAAFKALQFEWTGTDAGDLYDFCISRPAWVGVGWDGNGGEDAFCTYAMARGDITIDLPLSPGLYQMYVTPTGAPASLRLPAATWDVSVDGTPPVMGAVYIGEGDSSYWGVNDQVTFFWDAAVDLESGILEYDAVLVEVTGGSCGERSEDRLGGTVMATAQFGCGDRNGTLSVQLEHGRTYRVVMWAVNGAGLRTLRSSLDFMIDLSFGAATLGMMTLVDGNDEALNAVTYSHLDGRSYRRLQANAEEPELRMRVRFEAELETDGVYHISAEDLNDEQGMCETDYECDFETPDAPITNLEVFTFQLATTQQEGLNSTVDGSVTPNFTQSAFNSKYYIGNQFEIAEAEANTVRIGVAGSACCAHGKQEMPKPKRSVRHDAHLVRGEASSVFAAAVISDTLLAMLDGPSLVVLNMSDTAAGFVHMPLTLAASCQGASAIFGFDSGVCAVRICEEIAVFTVRTGLTSPSMTLPVPSPVDCDEKLMMAASTSSLFAWSTCPSYGSATLKRVSLTGSSSSWSTLQTFYSIQEGACLSCLSAHGNMFVVGTSSSSCAGDNKGSVNIYTGLGLFLASISLDASLGEVSGYGLDSLDVCSFGRTVLLTDQILLVGLPDAHGGAGVVRAYDIRTPSSPRLLCDFAGSKHQWRFGQSLARGGTLSSGLLLIAVGSMGMPAVAVRQFTLDTTGAPECIPHVAAGVRVPEVYYSPPPPPPASPPSIPPPWYRWTEYQPAPPIEPPPAPPANPPSPLPPMAPFPPLRPPGICDNRCQYDYDGVCDDGGPGAVTSLCVYGWDCADCLSRDLWPPSPPAGYPQSPSPFRPPPPPPTPNVPLPPDRPYSFLSPDAPPPMYPPSPRAPYTDTVALETETAKVLFARGHALVIVTTEGSLSYTSFCDRGSVRALSRSSPLPFECRRCPTGFLSTGGVSHACVLCDDLQCAQEGQNVFHTEFVGNSRNNTLLSSDRVLVTMRVYGKAQGGMPHGEQDSQAVILDLTEPKAGEVSAS